MSRNTCRHLISLADLSDAQLRSLVERGAAFARSGQLPTSALQDRVVGIYFRKTSTRTRTAFSVAALRLGAKVVSYGPNDLQENTGETADDTGRTLARMLDALVARTAGSFEEMRVLAAQNRMSVINAMTADEHPTQALADLTTMHNRFGRLEGLRVLYVGEGNNTAAALALALPRFADTELHLRTPAGYGLSQSTLEAALEHGRATGSVVDQGHDAERFTGAWGEIFAEGDPFFSPHLSKSYDDFVPEPGLTVKLATGADLVRMIKSGEFVSQLHLGALMLAELRSFISLR